MGVLCNGSSCCLEMIVVINSIPVKYPTGVCGATCIVEGYAGGCFKNEF